MVHYTKFDSPIGKLRLYFTEVGVCYIAFPNYSEAYVSKWCKQNLDITPEVENEYSHPAISQIIEYLTGKRKQFDFPIHHINTEFRKKTLDEVAKIPYGKTASYKDIAKRMGNPKACRAVGTANATNPLPLIIPCHRVISHNGKIGGFGGGLSTKKYLLNLEITSTNRENTYV